MTLDNWLTLLHPALAVIVVFPLIGIVVNFAWATRQRRLQIKAGNKKSKIPPVVGRDHVQLGKWLSASVVGIILVAFAHAILSKNIIKNQLFTENPPQAIFIVLMFALTIASLVFLYQARAKQWRAIFATLTGMGLVVLGSQDGVFRRSAEWYISHYYYGMIAALLMIFSLAIIDEIYKDKSLFWRRVHIVLNSIALLLFIGQGITGTRDIFEIGLYTPPPGLIFLGL
ncbi:hypothetical protein PCC7418_2423 [Halothece sp. PCC 7418]|uniref:DUF4079 domain-containing protein n=1 Tax=Halothece sp. (strain PCC 7418) TaxID=65093 RepID=UPI0002A0631F|nr:DUF4079 domain-containing protein [Halothece sp. PCC 7418]AFZ44570.1 hypothetical protein PCC7418_2423 [Halothece sp. PCC 7418]